MPGNTRRIALLSALALAYAASTQARAADQQWFMAANDYATVISNGSSDADRVLEELTKARTVMQQVVEVEPQPVRVFSVKNEASLRELVPQYWDRRGVRPQAASYAGAHAGFIVLRTDIPSPLRSPLLWHEYVHLLTAAHVPDAPAWLDEGLSEFWSAVVVDGGQAVVGRPPARHVKQLSTRIWLTADEMRQHQRGKLEANQVRTGMFYAQSWAMVHYLLLGENPNSPLRFAPEGQQWTPQLDAVLRAYVAKAQFREVALLSPRLEATVPAARSISEARALAERANMLVFGERPPAALPLARKALALNANEPLALEVMGTHYLLSNQPDQAREWLVQAFDADHQNYRAALYLALLSSSSGERERYLQAAVKAKPDLAVAWQRLRALYEGDGRLEQARRWCTRLTELLQPMLWVEPSRCTGQGAR